MRRTGVRRAYFEGEIFRVPLLYYEFASIIGRLKRIKKVGMERFGAWIRIEAGGTNYS